MLSLGLLLGLSALFWGMYTTTYAARRDCFNDQGRCFDADSGVVYLQQSGIVWLMLAVAASAAALFALWRWLRAASQKKAGGQAPRV